MRLLILGGTGLCGHLLIRDALTASHTVVVYARSPEKLSNDFATNPAVTVIKGDLTDVDGLSKAIEGVDAVVSALGPDKGHPSGTPLAHAYATIIPLMKKYGVKRLIALGTASIRDEHDKFSLSYSAMIIMVSTFARSAYKDIIAIGDTIRTQGDDLTWTIVRVGILTNDEKKDVVAGYVGDGKTRAHLARAAFADFVIGEVEKNEWCGQAPLISSP
ncbi:NAD-P-binding protein [Sparassis latifolia]|uniref:NAD(P)-binding domain-containing protein n=1 Tax=Sparassis crispa TaxID=139825 RepID=A0A401G8K1_9APHY|nr:predicted protein [Sparassis crispa]GBE78487.1 predicted protein [Sparassis crispa]